MKCVHTEYTSYLQGGCRHKFREAFALDEGHLHDPKATRQLDKNVVMRRA